MDPKGLNLGPSAIRQQAQRMLQQETEFVSDIDPSVNAYR